MLKSYKTAGLALAAGTLALSAPAAAAPAAHVAPLQSNAWSQQAPVYGDTSFDQYRGRDRYRDRHYGRDYRDQRQYNRYQAQPVYRDTRVWRGNDGRYYCRKNDGTTGLLIGGAAGALLGREIAGDRTLGAILGAAGGALLGREIDRGGSQCR
ncbi:glycine zipper 2TM domain-containing protein [Qipengyuania sp. MTN3-11]|uniref:glycine zipper 2TM domain-containing protein n=1 Tax=Qipengyuania sp. MTN3-11 TaxID=3056557 RepID=UPI0036F2DDA1